MDSPQNKPVYREDCIAMHLPATLQYCATQPTNENPSPSRFTQHVSPTRGKFMQINHHQGQLFKNFEVVDATTIPNIPEYWLQASAEIGYRRLYPAAEYGANWETLVPRQTPILANANEQQKHLHENQLLSSGLLRPPTVLIPDRQLQRNLLKFLMANLPLLNSVTNSTPDAMDTVQLAFGEDIHRSGLIPSFVDITKLFKQFEPTIGSPAIRQESDSRKTKATKRECPFKFCGGNFTRAAGLKNHLSAHFNLAPNECPRCGKYYSDVSFRRHVDSCRKAGSSHSNAQSLQV